MLISSPSLSPSCVCVCVCVCVLQDSALHVWKRESEDLWTPQISISGHSGPVTDCCWDSSEQVLFSCRFVVVAVLYSYSIFGIGKASVGTTTALFVHTEKCTYALEEMRTLFPAEPMPVANWVHLASTIKPTQRNMYIYRERERAMSYWQFWKKKKSSGLVVENCDAAKTRLLELISSGPLVS